MMISETLVHIAIRSFLKGDGWELLAGQFPGGSDDECQTLYVVDPAVARDQSPDPRRHSDNKQIPDLVALRGETLLVVEAKPVYSIEDRDKLVELLGVRREHLRASLVAHFARLSRDLPQRLVPIPCLAFAETSPAPWPDGPFAHVLVRDLSWATLRLPVEAGTVL
jgi:hypothetical protein